MQCKSPEKLYFHRTKSHRFGMKEMNKWWQTDLDELTLYGHCVKILRKWSWCTNCKATCLFKYKYSVSTVLGNSTLHPWSLLHYAKMGVSCIIVMLLWDSHGTLQRDTMRSGGQRSLQAQEILCVFGQTARDNRQRPHCLEWLESKRNRWDDLGLASWEANTKDPLHKQRIWRRLICLVKASLKA